MIPFFLNRGYLLARVITFCSGLLQGLSNTPQIVEYFENENYVEDINEDNPLGMKGEIARAFGQLIKDLWSGRWGDPLVRCSGIQIQCFRSASIIMRIRIQGSGTQPKKLKKLYRTSLIQTIFL